MSNKKRLPNRTYRHLTYIPKWPKRLTVILISALLLAILGAGGYMLIARQWQSSPKDLATRPGFNRLPSTTPLHQSSIKYDIPVTWRTYKDCVYSFQYPPSWLARGEYVSSYGGRVATISNPLGSVVIGLYPRQPTYGFAGPQSWVTNRVRITIEDQVYEAKETIRSNKKAFVDLQIPKEKNYHILFGTGYPAGSDSRASLVDYYENKQTILMILSTLAIERTSPSC